MRILLLLCVLISALARAAPYPDHPITLIVPFAEGSDTDLFARNFIRHAGKYLANAQFRLEYQPGESGAKAAQRLMHQPADGYTLMLGRISSQVIAPAMNPALPYQWNSFTTLSITEILPLVCAVRADAPYRDIRQLIAALRQKPGQLRYGTSGRGTILNFAVLYLLHVSGLPASSAKAIDLENSPKATQALIDGQVDFVCNNVLSLAPAIRSGQLRGLITTAPGRLAALPLVPNARESGLRDMGQVIGWNALLAPAGLPAEVRKRWQSALQHLSQDTAWQAASARLGGLPAIESIADPASFVRTQNRLYEQLTQNWAEIR